LSGEINGEKKIFNIVGGLPSGVRVTSLVGNVWNSIMTRIARDKCEQILGYDPVRQEVLRGDDSLIVCNTAAECYIFRLCYQSINAIGNNSKFGITQGEGEFLRTQITTDASIGWPVRAMPSLSQRKPWNPQPWDQNSEITTLVSNIHLLERRLGVKLDRIHHAAKMKWSKLVGQSYKWLELPKRRGGLGLYEWSGWVPDRRLPTSRKPLARVEGLGNPTTPGWMNLDESESKEYQQREFTAKMVADDIPGIQSSYSRIVIEAYKKLEVKWTSVKTPSILRVINVDTPHCLENTLPFWPKTRFKTFKPVDNSFPHIAEFLRQYTILKTMRGEKTTPLMQYLENVYPDFYIEAKSFEKSGWHRTDAFSLTLGDTPLEPISTINPTLSAFVKQAVFRQGLRYWRGRTNIADKLYVNTRLACEGIAKTRLHQLYRY